MSEQRYCRLCEIKEQISGTISDYADRYMELIREEDRASEEAYATRLEVCLSCEKRSEALCMACGCYIELRAAVKGNQCPYRKWIV